MGRSVNFVGVNGGGGGLELLGSGCGVVPLGRHEGTLCMVVGRCWCTSKVIEPPTVGRFVNCRNAEAMNEIFHDVKYLCLRRKNPQSATVEAPPFCRGREPGVTLESVCLDNS
jgi:hypothetical protein